MSVCVCVAVGGAVYGSVDELKGEGAVKIAGKCTRRKMIGETAIAWCQTFATAVSG